MAATSENQTPSKKQSIQRLLRRRNGTTLADMIKATGWQPHSVRAAMSRIRKTGTVIDRTATKSGTSRYRIVSEAKA
jgi:predicted ArsR family transcriptional regulator